MKFSKILTVVLLVSVLAISLIACSTSKDNKGKEQSTDSSISTLMATEPSNADEASKLYNQLMEKENEIFPVIKATVEKMAVITEKFLKGYQVPAVYVVGGSSMFKEFTTVFEKRLKLPVYRPVHPLLVTPLGIAYHCELPKI